jgi:hypothetical protein
VAAAGGLEWLSVSNNALTSAEELRELAALKVANLAKNQLVRAGGLGCVCVVGGRRASFWGFGGPTPKAFFH